MNERTCPVCGKVLVRREGEGPPAFRGRKTCGMECRNGYLAQINRERGERVFADRTPGKRQRCVACGEAFARRRSEPAAHYLKRQTCSWKCRNQLLSRARAAPSESKPCVICGELITSGTFARIQDYRCRSTCSAACAVEANRRARAKALREKREDANKPKPCVICGALFDMRKNERIPEFRRRRTCSPACRMQRVGAMGEGRRVHLPPKRCVICAEVYERANNEPTASFRKRRTCSLKCGRLLAAHNRRNGAPRTSPYPLEWTGKLRASIRARDGYRCVACGQLQGQRKFEVHHIDENKQNCSPANLATLCATCHRRVHSKRRGAKMRRLLAGKMKAILTEAA